MIHLFLGVTQKVIHNHHISTEVLIRVNDLFFYLYFYYKTSTGTVFDLGFKKSLKKNSYFIKTYVFSYSRITLHLLSGRGCLCIHQILILYLFIPESLTIRFSHILLLPILVHKCSNLFPEIKR